MAYFVFLGVIILSYFAYKKFLRRMFVSLLEYHHQAVEEDAREFVLSPATTLTAGQGELWENEFSENRFNEISVSYAVPNPSQNNNIRIQVLEVHQNNRRESNPILNPPYLEANGPYSKSGFEAGKSHVIRVIFAENF